MRVRMKTTAAGPGGTIAAGEVTTLPDHIAREMVRGGFAVAVREPVTEPVAPEPPPVETATVQPPENAKSRRGKRR